jgi:hypothetical protein
MTVIRNCFLFLVIIFCESINVDSQCIPFAKTIAKPKLAPFTHDGNYNATFMEEGETVELSKTFFSGQEYRLVFAAVEAIPKKVRIRILNEQMKVLFDNADYNYTYIWDFRAETTENLIVHLKIPENENSNKIIGGCVAIMFGIKIPDKRSR